jgi:hypothetical protein
MSFSGRRSTLRIVELVEHGAHATPSVYVLSHLAEEDDARPLQGLSDLDEVNDVVEWCAQVHDSDVRGVLLWEWSDLLLRKEAFERRARGGRWVAALFVPQGHHFDHGAKVIAFAAA